MDLSIGVVMVEIWKDVPGFEGYYEVSDLGNVRRLGKSKLLKKTVNKDGYHQYCFSVMGKHFNVCGHQLVALAFIGPRPQGMIPLHKDGNSTNNTPGNLRYGTNKENTADAVKHGTLPMGQSHGMSKLTEQQVSAIRASSGITQNELAALYRVSNGLISQIKSRRIWKHL